VYANPLAYIDPLGLAPNDPYPTPADVGKAAITEINPASIRQGIEYGGSIYKKNDGSYSYTQPNKGAKDHVSFGHCPLFHDRAGYYHTHGSDDPGYDNENFSRQDKQMADDNNVPSYLGTPHGDIKEYTPDPGHPGQGTVKTIGGGAK
jgi:hypothetical protein